MPRPWSATSWRSPAREAPFEKPDSLRRGMARVQARLEHAARVRPVILAFLLSTAAIGNDAIEHVGSADFKSRARMRFCVSHDCIWVAQRHRCRKFRRSRQRSLTFGSADPSTAPSPSEPSLPAARDFRCFEVAAPSLLGAARRRRGCDVVDFRHRPVRAAGETSSACGARLTRAPKKNMTLNLVHRWRAQRLGLCGRATDRCDGLYSTTAR